NAATLSNTGTVALIGANAFNGGLTATSPSTTTVNGTIQTGSNNLSIGNMSLGGTSTLSGGAISLTTIAGSGFGLTISNSNASVITGIFSGAGSTLTKNGAGSVTLSAANTYGTANVNSTFINAGTLIVGLSSTGAITNGPLGIGKFVLNGGILSSSGSFSIANPFNVTASSNIGGSNAITLNGNGVLTSGTLTSTNTATTTLNGIISGSGNLTENGTSTGTLILATANQYIGATAVTSGTLSLQNASGIGDGTNNSSSVAISGGTFNLNFGGGSLSNNAAQVTLNGGALTFTGSTSYTFNNTISLAANSNDSIGGTGTATVGSVINGTGTSLTKSGSGTITLTGNNSYSAPTIVSGGTLSIGSTTALGNTTSVTIQPSAILNIGFSNGTLANNSSITLSDGNLVYQPTGQVHVYNYYVGSPGGTLNVSGSGAILNNPIVLGQGTYLGGAGSLTLNGSVSGSSLNYMGSGTLVLNTSNSYGTTSVLAYLGSSGGAYNFFNGYTTVVDGSGTLQVNTPNALQGSVELLNGQLFLNLTGTNSLNNVFAFQNDGSGSPILTVSGNTTLSNPIAIKNPNVTIATATNTDTLSLPSNLTLFGYEDATVIQDICSSCTSSVLNFNSVSGSNITVSGDLASNYSGNIQPLSINKYGAGSLNLNKYSSWDNIYVPNSPVLYYAIVTKSTIYNGKLTLSDTNSTLNTSFVINSGGELVLNGVSIAPYELILNGGTLTGIGSSSISNFSYSSTPSAYIQIYGTTYTSGTYTSSTSLTADTAIRTLSAGDSLGLNQTIDGAFNLSLSGPGSMSFNNVVGSTTPLASITDNAGALFIGNNVTTTGSQTYNNPLTLGTNINLNATGANANININSSSALSANSLSIQASNITINPSVTFTSNLTLVASNGISLNNSITGTSGTLSLNAGSGTQNIAGSNVTINVANFILNQGLWSQINNSLPSFTVTNNFNINSASSPNTNTAFIRALGGAGTNVSPYIITDSYGLQGIGSDSATLGNSYILNNNIDLSSTNTWNSNGGFLPIGGDTYNFTGSLAGAGYTINNLNQNFTILIGRGSGLFGNIGSSGSVNNLGVVNANINNSNTVSNPTNLGILAATNSGTISSTYVTGSASANYSTGTMGSLVGFNSGTITQSYATASLSNNSCSNCSSAQLSIGGLVGNNSGTVSSSYTTSPINITMLASGANINNSEVNVGGLVGVSSGTVNTSYTLSLIYADIFDFANSINGIGSNIGGFVGKLNGGAINNSFSMGYFIPVNGVYVRNSLIGGFVGINFGSINQSFTTTGIVFSATPNLSQSLIGGFAGWNVGSVTNSFWDAQTVAASNTSWTNNQGSTPPSTGTGSTSGIKSGCIGGTCKNGGTVDLTQQSTYSGWNFTNTWGIVSGKSYPYLLYNYPTAPTVISGTSPASFHSPIV
ncbi:MAG: autotransporter-associated beta strand repeat-containing protein, partial [Gammaproteobacteria bacterium]|nr:autotransporter-associated beta strand repeat-containing protein [Gammaproteobacteria bacterium]